MHRIHLTIFALLVAATPAVAQEAGEGTVGTIVVAHGGGPEWDAHVIDVAGQVETGGPVEVSFLMGPGAETARFQDVVAKLEAQGVSRIVVVPVLVSSHSGHYEQIRYLAGLTDTLDEMMLHHLHMSGIERPDTELPIQVARAIDDAPELARVLADRALALTEAPAEQALFLIGHGANSAEDHAEWMANLRPIAETVEQLGGFRDVKIGLVRDDADPPVRAEAVLAARELVELQHEITGRPVVVVPILISKGSVSREKFPADLEGLPIIYGGEPILPHPEMANWIESRVSESLATVTAEAR